MVNNLQFSNLKQQQYKISIYLIGYFNIGDKLYCESCARAAKASEDIGQKIPTQPSATTQQQNVQQIAHQNAHQNVQQNVQQNAHQNTQQNVQQNAQRNVQQNAHQNTQQSVHQNAQQNVHQNVQQQQPKMVQQNPPQQQQQQNWDKILSNDKAGIATNAEDFTKQFMGQMYGNNGTNHSSKILRNPQNKSIFCICFLFSPPKY